jgi:hypothetical protein
MKRILVIRSVKSELLPFFVEKWGEKFPGANFELLTHPASLSSGLEIIKERFPLLFKKIHIYNYNGDYSYKNIQKEIRKELKSSKYDMVIVPHKGESIDGFTNVILLAFSISSKVFHGNLEGELHKVPKLFIVKYIIKSFMALAIFSLMLPFVVLTLIISILSYKIKEIALNKKSNQRW